MNRKYFPMWLPIRSVVFLLVFLLLSLITSREVSKISSWWSIIDTILNVCTIIFLVSAAKKNNMSFAELINYQKGKTTIKQIIAITLVILVVGMAGMYLAGFLCYGVIPYAAPMLIAPIPKILAIINVFFLPVTTAFAEDGLYLGFGVNNIKNKTCAILIPAFFFALQHCFIPTLFDAKYIMYRFLSFLPLTIILCWYYNKKRNPLPIMIGHTIIDIATVMQILATSTISGFYEKMCSAV